MGVVGTEAAAIGVDVVFAPVVNMMTDPRFGRLQEGYSSNPLLTSHLARAAVRALQKCDPAAGAASCGPSAYLASDGVGACRTNAEHGSHSVRSAALSSQHQKLSSELSICREAQSSANHI